MIDIALRGNVGAFEFDAEFQASATGVTAILGRSGSGKTTLLRAIAGLLPCQGHVHIGDLIWQRGSQRVPVHKRGVGMLFQEPSLFTHQNVRQNLDYAWKRSLEQRLDPDTIIDEVAIRHLLPRSVTTLSGGERQRVALARLLLSSPRLILMDEPLSSLDQLAKIELLELIKAISQAHDLPVFYVAHDRAEILRLTDRVLHLKAGRIETNEEPAFEETLSAYSRADIEDLAIQALRAGCNPGGSVKDNNPQTS